MGTRGVPANYGGFETFAEELSCRLVERGHDVTVYCRSHHAAEDKSEHRGARLVVLPTLRTKHLDTPVHTLLSSLHALSGRFDAVLVCNAANAIFLPLLKLTGAGVAINVDGLEWKRKKWSFLGKTVYRLSERLSYAFSHALVTDARAIESYYRERHGRDSFYIPYGAPTEKEPPGEMLAKLGLEPGGYFLYAARFEPENNAHLVVDAFSKLRTDRPLIMVGAAPYSQGYISRIKSLADERVRFTGAVYGAAYRELMSHAYCYIHATEVGGTHPGLLEGMGLGNGVLVSDIEENRETAAEGAVYFDLNEASLLDRLRYVLEHPDELASSSESARRRVREFYDWDRITDSYDRLLRSIALGVRVEPRLKGESASPEPRETS